MDARRFVAGVLRDRRVDDLDDDAFRDARRVRRGESDRPPVRLSTRTRRPGAGFLDDRPADLLVESSGADLDGAGLGGDTRVGAVAGEIERGTVDITLSRPVSRSMYLSSQVLFSTLGLIAMVAALVLGTLIGSAYFGLKTPPSLATLLRPATMIVTLGMAVFGTTVPFSAVDVARWRPNLIAATITLAGLIALSVANQFPDYEKVLQKLSVFQMYAPVTVALKGEPFAYNTTVLLIVFAIGTAIAYPLFIHRDIPSNS